MNKAFTLAEVLITLGIIGIVAAMTIPAFTNHIKAVKFQSQFKKAYADLNQASKNYFAQTGISFQTRERSIQGNGGASWDSSALLIEFMSYIKGASKEGARSNVYGPQEYDNKNRLKNLNLANQNTTFYPCDESGVVKDMVGRIWTMDNITTGGNLETGPKICLDINGDNRPNKWGVDRFVFVFAYDDAVIPYTGTSWNGLGKQEIDENIIKKYCNSTVQIPHACAYFAAKNINPEGYGDYWHDFLQGKY